MASSDDPTNDYTDPQNPDELEDMDMDPEADEYEEDIEGDAGVIQAHVKGIMGDVSAMDEMADMTLMQNVYYIWLLWVDFHIFINQPYVPPQYPPKVILPGKDPKTGQSEYVYSIFDFGDHFSTSVGENLARGTRSTGQLLNTIYKIISLVITRVQSIDVDAGGEEGGDGKAIRVAFDGHEIGQRMAFKQCVMNEKNILVTNFDPGDWGERQLRTMEVLAEKGYLPGLKK
jgi:hypothetical protein